MTPAARRPAARHAWLTMGEASELIGVSQATLRRWAEAGDVEAFVTPGGHRRFDRSALLRLLPGPAARHRSLRDLGETPERMVRQYRRELAGATSPAWLPSLDPAERETFREPGRRILATVLAFLDAPSEAEAEAQAQLAAAAAAEYGRLAADRGLSLPDTTAAFLRFRAPFLEELATMLRRRRIEASDAISVILAAASFFDRLLLALLQGHHESGEPAPRPPAAMQPARTGT